MERQVVQGLKAYETKFWVVILLSHMKDHLIPRRMQFTASRISLSVPEL